MTDTRTSREKLMVTCMVLEEAGLGRDCCASCHSDDEDGYSGLCGISGLPDDLDADEYVCCSHVGRTFTPEELDRIREASRAHFQRSREIRARIHFLSMSNWQSKRALPKLHCSSKG